VIVFRMTVEIRTDGSENFKGFKLKWTRIESGIVTNSSLVAPSSPPPPHPAPAGTPPPVASTLPPPLAGNISSPGYRRGRLYPDNQVEPLVSRHRLQGVSLRMFIGRWRCPRVGASD
jgi:hypothetical protein